MTEFPCECGLVHANPGEGGKVVCESCDAVYVVVCTYACLVEKGKKSARRMVLVESV